ncbi:MAG TPA: RNA methyltransferase [Saprospiraceae bacterium]|nr:RNA methyltransferase [Saprospiraceae bacterium]HMQ81375.1 RNA methyltransferase [Saprospiraceae bacterium]
MTAERLKKIRQVARQRQADLTVVLENVHDTHNIGAVLRSCDSVGIREVFVLYSDPFLNPEKITVGKRSSGGTKKWVDVHLYTDTDACFAHVRKNYHQIWATHLDEAASSIYELDFNQSMALLFGNEHDGISQASLAHADGNFIIPQVGMAQSLNVSVACAVTLYEAFRQRKDAGKYEQRDNAFTRKMKSDYEARAEQKGFVKKVFKND